MAYYLTGAKGFIGRRLSKILDVQDKLEGAEGVIHLAAYGNHSWQTDIEEIFRANVLGTQKILEECRLNGIKNFIFIGTSSEYGMKDKPMTESDLPEAKTMYACSKICGTYLTRHYSNYFNAVTIRPFSVYGEEEDDRRFIPMAIRCLNNGEVLNLDPNATHDWVYIDSLVHAIIKITQNMSVLNGQIINVCSGKCYSNIEIVKMLEEISGKRAKINIVEGQRKNDSPLWVGDNAKLKSLGWIESTNIIDGLEKVYEFYKKKT